MHNTIANQDLSCGTAFYARTLRNAAIAALVVLPCLAMAQVGGTDLAATTCGFFKSVSSVLNGLSIVVVTIAIVFSGYQIAFAHKRISDVAPVFIGALIIGAASQIAKLFLSGSAGTGACTASIPSEALIQVASIVQSLSHYA